MSKSAPFNLSREFDTRLNLVAFVAGAGWGLLLQLNIEMFSQALPVVAFVITPCFVTLTIGLFCRKLLHVVLAAMVYVLGQGMGGAVGFYLRTFAILPSIVMFFAGMINFTVWFWLILLGFGVRRLIFKQGAPQPTIED